MDWLLQSAALKKGFPGLGSTNARGVTAHRLMGLKLLRMERTALKRSSEEQSRSSQGQEVTRTAPRWSEASGETFVSRPIMVAPAVGKVPH